MSAVAAQTTCLPSLSGFFLGSDFCSPCYRWFHGHCRMHHGCAVRMETVQVQVASSLSVVLTWWSRRTTPMAPDFLRRYQSEASQSTTKVTKHSAATAGQLPLGTGGEFPVDQRRIFGTSNRENFIDMFFHSVASNLNFPDLERHSVAVQEMEQWIGLCLVPVRSRTHDEQLEALTQVPSPQVQPSLVSLRWFRGDTSPSAELRSPRHLCNDRCRWSKQRLKQ